MIALVSAMAQRFDGLIQTMNLFYLIGFSTLKGSDKKMIIRMRILEYRKLLRLRVQQLSKTF